MKGRGYTKELGEPKPTRKPDHIASMANLKVMPPIVLPVAKLALLGQHWKAAASELPKTKGELVGKLCDETVGHALAEMLGGISIEKPKVNSLLPVKPDCVEIGPTRVIGGIRPQNFDVAYRPDGVRFAYDSKTLNGRKSLSKNYQNMVNDLGQRRQRFTHDSPLQLSHSLWPCLSRASAITGAI